MVYSPCRYFIRRCDFLYNKLTKCVEKLVKIIEAIGNICVWGMFAIIFINTVLRVIIGYSLPWAEEISKLLMVWMAMIVSAVCLYEGRQVALTDRKSVV